MPPGAPAAPPRNTCHTSHIRHELRRDPPTPPRRACRPLMVGRDRSVRAWGRPGAPVSQMPSYGRVPTVVADVPRGGGLTVKDGNERGGPHVLNIRMSGRVVPFAAMVLLFALLPFLGGNTPRPP